MAKIYFGFYFNDSLVEKYTSPRNTGPYEKAYSYTSFIFDKCISSSIILIFFYKLKEGI